LTFFTSATLAALKILSHGTEDLRECFSTFQNDAPRGANKGETILDDPLVEVNPKVVKSSE
jgi:hypothetical protein